MTLAARVGRLLARHWWRRRPSMLSQVLRPLAGLYGVLARADRARTAPQRLPRPVVVVGNWVAGGAGKTPTVIALVQALQAAGHRPGVISRGYGRTSDGVRLVHDGAAAAEVGDEPLLIRRRTGVPVAVGSDRVAAGHALMNQHPLLDVIVSDDGLQHHRLAWDAAVVVFDERGAGNGLLLPAGPLREALPAGLPPAMQLLYTSGVQSTVLSGALAQRRLGRAWPLAAWLSGDAGPACELERLRGRPLLAAAGLAAPEKFFGMLEAAGLSIEQRLALPDHHAYAELPWPAGTADVVTTEKDAVKLAPQRLGGTRVWVVPLDLLLPAGLIDRLLPLLAERAHCTEPTAAIAPIAP